MAKLLVLVAHGGDLRRHLHPARDPPRHLQHHQDLMAAIQAFIDGWNDRGAAFVWTKTADQIIPHARKGQPRFNSATLGGWC